jgi:hypothetical protein
VQVAAEMPEWSKSGQEKLRELNKGLASTGGNAGSSRRRGVKKSVSGKGQRQEASNDQAGLNEKSIEKEELKVHDSVSRPNGGKANVDVPPAMSKIPHAIGKSIEEKGKDLNNSSPGNGERAVSMSV